MDAKDWSSKREGKTVNVTLQPMATSILSALDIPRIIKLTQRLLHWEISTPHAHAHAPLWSWHILDLTCILSWTHSKYGIFPGWRSKTLPLQILSSLEARRRETRRVWISETPIAWNKEWREGTCTKCSPGKGTVHTARQSPRAAVVAQWTEEMDSTW